MIFLTVKVRIIMVVVVGAGVMVMVVMVERDVVHDVAVHIARITFAEIVAGKVAACKYQSVFLAETSWNVRERSRFCNTGEIEGKSNENGRTHAGSNRVKRVKLVE